MSTELWGQYEAAISHWKPVFGNEAHISACDKIAEINRMMPQYLALKEKRAALKTEEARNRPSKRMNQLHDDISRLMQGVLHIVV